MPSLQIRVLGNWGKDSFKGKIAVVSALLPFLCNAQAEEEIKWKL